MKPTQKTICFFCIIVLVFSCFFFILFCRRMFLNDRCLQPVLPSSIFYHWSGEESSTVNYCTRQWKRYYPNIPIHHVGDVWFQTQKKRFTCNSILNQHTDYKTDFKLVSKTLKSDIFRLVALYEYGGLYLDASIFLFDTVNIPKNCDVMLITNSLNIHKQVRIENRPIQIAENSLVYVSTSKNKFIGMWLQTILNFTSSPTKYSEYLNFCKKVYYVQKKKYTPTYHHPYFALMYMQWKDPDIIKREKVFFSNPKHFFGNEKDVVNLCRNSCSKHFKVLKLCRKARQKLDEYLKNNQNFKLTL